MSTALNEQKINVTVCDKLKTIFRAA